MKNKALITSLAILAVLTMLFSSVYIAFAVPPVPVLLDPKTIPKYVNQLLANIPVYTPTTVADAASPSGFRQDYTVGMTSFRQQILPAGTPIVGGDGLTKVWGYNGTCYNAVTGANLGNVQHSPSASFIATRGTPSQVTWQNNITEPQFLPVDPTIMWANPNNMATPTPIFTAFPPGYAQAQAPVPLVPHLHGSEVQSYFDGGPEAWFTYNGIQGPTYNTRFGTDTNAAVYYYNNAQEPSTLWYHDHALGITRLNVMSGLAGYYLLRDPTDPVDAYLSTKFQYGVSEIPIAIQDRSFYANGELWFPTVGVNPSIHPYWMPEFFGNTIMVNGLVWPNMNVNQGWYRFRLLDGSNARFYTLSFSNKMPFMVIGTEGGYLQQSALLNSITIAPGERADVLVDFSAVPAGTKIILQNSAKAPFPNGAAADPQTVGQIMQFTVVGTPGVTAPVLPAPLNPTLPVGAFPIAILGTPTTTRYLTLVEVMGPLGPTMVLINGQGFADPVTETPTEGTTEDWVIINLTADTHPIHTHLASFQLFGRQRFQAAKYMKDWLALNALKIPATGMLPFTSAPTPLPPTSYLQGKVTPALPNEMGWKDTVQMNPGEVTTIRIRFTQQDGTPYPFDPKLGPGYVWHCHIIDHEDNEMMRPYIVV